MKPKDNLKFDRILRAAVKVFAQKGFFHTRVADVAKEAGVADGTVYLYFKNKDDILISLFETEMDKIIARTRQELAEEDGVLNKLKRFARVYARMVLENQNLAEVIQIELRQSNKFMKEYQNEKFMEYLRIIGGLVEEGQREGVIRPDIKPIVFKRSYFGALDETATFWVLSKKKSYDLMETVEQIGNIFIGGIRT